MKVSLDRLRDVLSYDAETGVFVWRMHIGPQAVVGEVAGTLYANGRRYITIERKRYFASRLAWFYFYGEWPIAQIDHINVNRSDDRISNLRQATGLQNARNKGILSTNRLGIKGVGISTDRKRSPQRYRARIRVDGRLIHLGYFTTPESAHQAYKAAATHHFGEFARA